MLVFFYSVEEVSLVQNLVYYVERAYRTPDFGPWGRGQSIRNVYSYFFLLLLNTREYKLWVFILQLPTGIAITVNHIHEFCYSYPLQLNESVILLLL
jgi:hypothetical protein